MMTTNLKDRRSTNLKVAAALALACAALAQPALAGRVTPPPVPDNLTIPPEHHAFLMGAAVGTQNYTCVPSTTSATGVAYALFTPEATLFNGDQQVMTHFFSPNPNPDDPNTSAKVIAAGAIRATWQHSHDSSVVWAKVRPADPTNPTDIGDASTDPRFVARGAVAWLKLTVTGTAFGPDGGDILEKTTFVQRLNTQGGLAPATGCSSPADLGNQAFIPYTADYFFYTDR
jgi:hypothetical protein